MNKKKTLLTMLRMIQLQIRVNPIQAGVFWYHIGGGGGIRFSFICCPITTKLVMVVLKHKISQGQ